MKNPIYLSIVLTSILLILAGCKTPKKSSGYLNVQPEAKTSGLQLNLGSSVNSASKEELNRNIYQNKTYFMVQEKTDQFKDNAPFIEILDGGARERLWFTSSRADELSYGVKRTNHHQQLYYTERVVGQGLCPKEGWGEVSLFQISDENPLLKDYPEALAKFKSQIAGFNKANKGAVTLAGDKMILSCDQIDAGIMQEFKQLWSLDRNGDQFANPKPITTLSGGKTWESQPTLSANAKHLFFVSNRKTNLETGEYSESETGEELNIFYSFFSNGEWGKPVLVKELCSGSNDITPHLALKRGTLLFSSDRSGGYNIYEVPVQLDDERGGYRIENGKLKLFDRQLIDLCDPQMARFDLNDAHSQTYPYYYYNPANKKVTQALFWSSNDPGGYGSFDIYGCAMPFEVRMNVVLADKSANPGSEKIEYPVIELSGDKMEQADKESASFLLYSGLKYQLKGGSTASVATGTYYCDRDPRYIMTGYSEIANLADPSDRKSHSRVLDGPRVASQLTSANTWLPLFNLVSDTVMNDTIFITKAWELKPRCPEVLDIPPKHRAIAYFQTGFWEVNTTENLMRDLKKLHEGYEVTPTGDLFKPEGKINFSGSDYRVNDWESLLYPVNTKDHRGYSIAHARWIELHPNNFYWGDRPGYNAALASRMKGRRDRIEQYVEFAKKVDENLKILTDTIKQKYISFLDLHRSSKPKLLVEIFAVSDQREVLRGWYIGDTVAYRGSEYLGDGKFKTEQVKIVPPKVNETTKTVEEILNCSIDLNEKGNNGTKLGINSDKTELNTNLSRLRAWFGYKEVIKRLNDSDEFKRYLNKGKVALPDNNVNYDDAEIIIITRGRRIDIIDPKYSYPEANNPNGQGFYDFDQIRRVEIRIRLLMDDKTEQNKDFCCWREGR